MDEVQPMGNGTVNTSARTWLLPVAFLLCATVAWSGSDTPETADGWRGRTREDVVATFGKPLKINFNLFSR